MKISAKTLINLRRISQIVFLLLFIFIVARTMNHSFLEEEATARLEEQSTVFHTRTKKSFPLLLVTAALSAAALALIFVIKKKNKIDFKQNRKLLSFTIVSSIIFITSVIFSIIPGISPYFSSSNGLPAARIKITPAVSMIILALFILSFLISVLFLVFRLIKKDRPGFLKKWIGYVSIIVFVMSLLLIFGIVSYHPDTRFFKPGPAGIPFFSFDKYNYNLDIPSTMFIETSALIGITTSIASRAMTVSIVYILGMLIIALIFGRAFCGWVCPLGTLNHFMSWIKQKFRKKKFPAEPFNKWQRIKYVILVIILFSSVFGVTLTGFFDPFSILPRSVITVGMPAARSLIEKTQDLKRKAVNTRAKDKVSGADDKQQENNAQTTPPEENQEPNENSNSNSQMKESGKKENESGQDSPYANSPTRNSEKTSNKKSGDNPYANAPTRKSTYSEQEENIKSESNPYTSAPTRKAEKKETDESNPYANAPTRKKAKENTATTPAENDSPYKSSPTRKSPSKSENKIRPDKKKNIVSKSISLRERLNLLLTGTIFNKKKRLYDYFVFSGLFILVLLCLNFIKTRFWCRYVCGLGALYGLVGQYSIMRIKQNEKCTNCKMCTKFCQGACNPDIKDDFKSAECIYCFNCLDKCKFDALEVSFEWEKPVEKEPKQTDIDKRSVIKGLVSGLGAMFLFKTNFLAKRVNPKLVRPPGSLPEPNFLSLCIKCGNCMRICPNNFLQPTMFEAGLEGMYTPIGNARKGFCSPTCTLCSKACPTGAIKRLNEADRGFYANGYPKMKIGTAHVNSDRCITYVYQRKCLVCEEHCPTSPKAIWKRDVKVVTRDGKTVTIGQPVITPERCIGCGVCQHVCPVVDEPGIEITSVGETRNPKNEFSLTSQ